MPPAGPEPPRPLGRGEVLCLLAILALAAALRVPGIDTDLWLDEVMLLTDGVRLPLPRLLSEFSSETVHVLYALAAKLSLGVLGESAAAPRLPAAILGVLSIWAVWWLGRTWMSPREGLLAAALTAVSFSHVWFSQNARGYTGLLLATLLSTGLYLRARHGGGNLAWMANTVTILLGMWIHLTMVFVALAHAAVALADRFWARTRHPIGWKPLGAIVLAGLLTLLVYASALPGMSAFFLDRVTRPPRTSQFRGPQYLAYQVLDRFAGANLGLAVTFGAGILLAIGAVSLWRRDRRAAASSCCRQPST